MLDTIEYVIHNVNISLCFINVDLFEESSLKASSSRLVIITWIIKQAFTSGNDK